MNPPNQESEPVVSGRIRPILAPKGPGQISPGQRPGTARKLLIGLLVIAVLAVLGGVAARLRAAHQLHSELAEAGKEMEAGLLASARRRLARLAGQWPDQAEVAYQLGRCEAARGRPEAAMAAWARIRPDSSWAAPAALEFARAAIPMGRIAEAERILQTALHGDGPQRSAARHLLLVLLGQQGRISAARRLIESLWSEPAAMSSEDWVDRLAMVHEHAGLDLEPFPLEWNLSQLEAGVAPRAVEEQRALTLARAHLATRAGDFRCAETELESCLARWPDDPMVWWASLDWAVAADRFDRARAAIDHVPAGLLDAAEILELRAWFARRRQDTPAERRALEELIALEPGRTTALTRLAELLQQAGEATAAAAYRRRKAELDAAMDRYNRLYKEDRAAEHLPELASLAERLGRAFEAGAFRELIAARAQSNVGPSGALVRPGRAVAPASPPSGSLGQLLAAEVGPIPARDRVASPRGDPTGGPSPQFADRAASAGLAGFIQDNGGSPIHQLPESMSGGVGLLDYDGDGFLDIYCVQGGPFPPGGTAFQAAGDHGQDARAAIGDRLYRNRGVGRFEDVTLQTGIGGMPCGYGHGIAVGDIDNDGHPDLFLTRWRAYALYRNRGDGTFEDATERAGLGGDRDWPTSAAFADLDNDGDLDLYVCHYGAWNTQNPPICRDPSGAVIIACDPRTIPALPDHVFRNDGGRFVDVTAEAGIVDRDGRGLGVVAADLDGDGRIDLFVANDSTANFLFRNQGGFRFEEIGHAAGVAANAAGGYQAGMGVACGDVDRDGWPDLAVTNFYGESTTLFHNLGRGLFADHTAAVGLAAPSRHRLGFGAAFLDANNDGWLDLITANGHISDQRPLFPRAMRAQLFLGNPAGTLSDVTAQAGPPFQQPHVGRGLAVGDLDNDGRLDAVMVAQNEPLVVFRNETGSHRGHFVTFRLEGTRSNRDGVGAVVTVEAGGRSQVAPRLGGGSFQSAGDGRLPFGLGPEGRVDSVEVRWPSGRVDRHRNLAADRGYRIREGDATVRPLEGFRS
jgi:tetratricopeptide (TPR) repeat protein